MKNSIKLFYRCYKPSALAITFAALNTSITAAQAQTQTSDLALEEVIVTAQKRAQSLQDVPLSVVAVSGEKLDESGIENIEDLTILVPNLQLTETGIGTQLLIRGIGSGINQGFEQSVGVYVNGVYRSRAQLFRAPIFDMERVEVLRGPQGILFGKNSVAGALELITAKPTDELEGKITTSYETEFETFEVTGVVSGPISDSVNARLAIRSYSDDGYIYNEFKKENEPSSEENSVRLSLNWQANDNLEVDYVGERDIFDINGRQIEIFQDLPNPALGPIGSYSAFAASLGEPSFETELNLTRGANAPEFSDNTIDSHNIDINYQWNDILITSVTGYVAFDSNENCDCDYVPASVFDLALQEDYEQISQEIRFTSAPSDTLEWLGGLFYQSYDQEFSDFFKVPQNSLLLTASQFLAQLTNDPSVAIPNSFGASGIDRQFEQSSKASAIFGELTYSFTDRLRLAIGARFTEEKKEATKLLNIVGLNRAIITNPLRLAQVASVYKVGFKVDTEQTRFGLAPTPDGGFVPAFPTHQGHDLDESRTESSFTPSIKLTADVLDDALAYISYSTGFKAGGFDPRSNSNINFEFEEETADAFELGYKTPFFDGRGEVNIALYRTVYEDLQISQFDGGVGFNVGNAKETVVQGFEVDGRWLFNEHLSARYALSWLDFEYTDFENGNCNQEQEGQDLNGDGINECSYTGLTGALAPENTLNIGLDYSRTLNQLLFLTTLDVQIVDEQNTHINLSENGIIDAYTLLNLRIALEGEHWGVALLGKNLLDEEIISFSGNAPLSDNILGSNTLYGFVRRPRTLAAEISYTF